MPVAITTIAPAIAMRGTSGSIITITGTGFEAAQGGGSVEIGAIAATIVV